MKLRKLSAVLGAFALTFGLATTALATAPTGHQVTICHATDSDTNPYIKETVDIGSSGFLQGGHNGHTGPLWNATLKDQHIAWGDIIPAYDYETADNGTFHFDGLNTSPEGLAILAHDCAIVPDIHVEKTPSVDNLPAGGGPVTYTYVVTNPGSEPLTNVTVTDDKCATVTYVSGDTNSNDKLDIGETWTFNCTATLTETTTNVATATGHGHDATVTDTDTATVTVAASAPAIHVVKSPSVTSLPAGGGVVTYTYTVTNTGNIALTNVTASDDKCSPVTFVSGDTGADGVLGLTETWTYTCTTTLTATTTNIVTATGHDGQTEVSDTDTATVTVLGGGVEGDAPAIHIVKTPSVTTLPVGGGSVTYTYVVTNTGDVVLTDVSVADNKCTPVAYQSGDANSDAMLDLSETWTYSCTATLTATTTNTAVATGHDGNTPITDTDQATVTVTAPGGGVQGETSPPTAPPTDIETSSTTGSSGSLPILLLVLGVIGLGALALTPARSRR